MEGSKTIVFSVTCLNIADKVTALRKSKNWSQSDLAKATDASRDIIGKYERNKNCPSIEMALKIAKIFQVPVDFLLIESKHANYDNDTANHIEKIQVLDSNTKSVLLNLIVCISETLKPAGLTPLKI